MMTYVYQGEALTVQQLVSHPANKLGFGRVAISARIRANVPNQDFFRRSRERVMYCFMGQYRTVSEIVLMDENIHNLDRRVINNRFSHGWQEKDILLMPLLLQGVRYPHERVVWKREKITSDRPNYKPHASDKKTEEALAQLSALRTARMQFLCGGVGYD